MSRAQTENAEITHRNDRKTKDRTTVRGFLKAAMAMKDFPVLRFLSVGMRSGYGRVCTSTERTDGKSRTMGAQVSPPSGEQYTWPPVVPK